VLLPLWFFRGTLSKSETCRRLEGRMIEIEGEVKSYDGRAEIILRWTSQLRGDGGRLPPVPKEYDVERHGKFSAGSLRFPKSENNDEKVKTTSDGDLGRPCRDGARLASPLWLTCSESVADGRGRPSLQLYTSPFLNSSNGYVVPRHVTPSFRSVSHIERSSV
jgi:hypothetical protein